ncbi:unnamed protein product, partial [Dicrocoelium dendriticum]
MRIISPNLIFHASFPSRLPEVDLNAQLLETDSILSSSLFDEAIQRYELLSDLVLDSLNYYHRYDRTFLG